MPKLVHRVPAYKLHKCSGRGRARHGGKDIWFPGPFGSKESRETYARFIAGLDSQGGTTTVVAPELLSISELILAYSEYAEQYYRKDGRPTGEHVSIKYAVRPLEALYGLTLAVDLGPKKLKLVRDEMI